MFNDPFLSKFSKKNPQRKLRRKVNWANVISWILMVGFSIFVLVITIRGIKDLFWTGRKLAELNQRVGKVEVIQNEMIDIVDRALKIKNFLKGKPLEGYSLKFVITADKYNLDWRLLPAISMQESSGGEKLFRKFNPFGWGNRDFESFDEAIEIVGWNLAGENPNTAQWYKDKTLYEKLWYYNGTVEASYPYKVMFLMEKISK